MTSAVQSSSPTLRDRTSDLLARSGLLIALLLLFLALALFAPNFLTSRNLLNVLRAVAFNGIIACGMTFMIIAGDIDVSVGSAVAWASALLGVLAIQHGWPLGLGNARTHCPKRAAPTNHQ